MKKVKRIISAVLTAALLAQTSLTAGAAVRFPIITDDDGNVSIGQAQTDTDTDTNTNTDTKSADNENTENIADYVFPGDTLPCSQNDPQYSKAVGARAYTPMTTALWGSKNIIHQKRFDDCEKIYGIDVSKYQYNIDWNKVKNAGVEYAIIRVGFRGYGNGQIVLDDTFAKNIKGAKAAGIDVGVYFFTQAISTAEAKQEANFVLKQLKGYSLEMPVYFDIENSGDPNGRLDAAKLSKSYKTSICSAFCDTIIDAGYDAGIYANKYWLAYEIDGSKLEKKYPVWLANYTDYTDYEGKFVMWQYTGSGSVNGIETYVDMDVFYQEDLTPAKVGGFKYINNGETLTLSWDKSDDCDGYAIFRKTPGGKDETKLKEVTASTVSAEVALTDKNCEYYVKAFKKPGKKYFWSEPSQSVVIKKNTVIDLKLDLRSYKAIVLSWSEIADASGYEAVIYKEDSKEPEMTYYVNSSSFKFTGLDASTVYRFKIRPYFNADGSAEHIEGVSVYGSYCDEFSAGTYPNTVENLRVTKSTSTSVTIQWDSCTSYCDGYQVAIVDNETGKKTSVGTTAATSFTYKGFKSGDTVRLTVRPYYKYDNKNIYGYFCTQKGIASEPAAPSVYRWVSDSPTALTLRWTKVKNATAYKIFEVRDGENIEIGQTAETTFSIKDLDKDGVYTYYVMPIVEIGNDIITGKKTSSIKLCPGLAAPQNLKIVSGGTKQITVSWKNVSGADKYIIYLCKPGSSAYNKYATVTSTTYKFNLNANSDYKIKIRAVKGDAEGAVTNIFSISTKAAVPQNFKVTAYSSTAVRIKWNAVPGATSYKVYRYDTAKKKYVLLGTAKTPAYRLGDSAVNTEYRIKVKADYNGTIGATSSEQKFYTRPAIPKNLKWKSKTSSTVTFSWSKASGASSYRIYLYDCKTGKYVVKKDVSGTTCTLTGLSSARRYKVKVASIRKATSGEYLSVASGALSMGTTGYKYYPKTSYKGPYLYSGLVSVGVYATNSFLKKLAEVNSIYYTGTDAQNKSMLDLLKKGKLMIPR